MDGTITLAEVDWFDNDRGFGVLKSPEHGSLFLHRNNVIGSTVFNPGNYAVFEGIKVEPTKNRKAALNVTKINEANIEGFLKHFNKQDTRFTLKLYGSIGYPSLKAFINRETERITKIESFKEYEFAIIFINDYLSRLNHAYSELINEAKLHLFNVSSDFYKNVFWLYYHFEIILNEHDSINDVINNSTLSRKYNLCPQDIFITANFVQQDLFRLSDSKFEAICEATSRNQLLIVAEQIFNKIGVEGSIDITSKAFLFILRLRELKKQVETFLRQNWPRVNGSSDIITLTQTVNVFSEQDSWVIDVFFENLSKQIVERMIQGFLDGGVKYIPSKYLIDKINEDLDFTAKFIRSENGKAVSSSAVREAIVIKLYEQLGSIDTFKKYEYLLKLLKFQMVEEVCKEVIKYSPPKYRLLLKGAFNLWQRENEYQIGSYINEVGKYLGYLPEAIEKLKISIFPNRDLAYFDRRAQLENWGPEWSSRMNYETLLKLKNLLYKEITLTKTLREDKRKEIHSATDLAGYSFCPASYVTLRLYEVSYEDNYEIFNGTEQHEKRRLLSYVDEIRASEGSNVTTRIKSRPELIRIVDSELISSGHAGKPIIYFSKNRKLCGSPDYIFQDKDGVHFAVEEKFTFGKREGRVLFENHRIQALTYLYGINDYEFSEVYVIYWYMTFEDNKSYVNDFEIFSVGKSENGKKLLLSVFESVESLNKNGTVNFSPNMVNYNKCIRCSAFSHCDFKKGTSEHLSLT
jgi:cold shock CspA family protein